MQLLALIPLLLVLLKPLSVHATTPDNDNMEKLNPPVSILATTADNKHMEKMKLEGVRRDCSDQSDSGVEELNLTCDDDGGDDGGNDASIQDNRGPSKPKKRAVRATHRTFVYRGMKYHIEINSSLGETYRNLPTKAEQREFAMEHGLARPVLRGCRVRAVQ